MNLKGSPESIVAQFVIEIRAKGAFLSVDEYNVIKKWIQIEPDADQILLTLSDVFADVDKKASKEMQRSCTKSLTYYEKKVSRMLLQNRIAKA